MRRLSIVMTLILLTTQVVAGPPITPKEKEAATKELMVAQLEALNEHVKKDIPTRSVGVATRPDVYERELWIASAKHGRLVLKTTWLAKDDGLKPNSFEISAPWKQLNETKRYALAADVREIAAAWLASQPEADRDAVLAGWDKHLDYAVKGNKADEFHMSGHRYVIGHLTDACVLDRKSVV